jgi:tetratricopeptide (TPR) repeat protein
MENIMSSILLPILLIIVVVFSVSLGIFLHRQRKQSTKAIDYFQRILSDSKEKKSEAIVMKEEDNNFVSQNTENNNDAVLLSEKDMQRKTYRELVELFRNRVIHKNLKKDNTELNEEEFVTLQECAIFLDLDIESIENFLLHEDWIEKRYGVIFLTDKGMGKGGKYDNEEDKIIIKWKKENLLNMIKRYQEEVTLPSDFKIIDGKDRKQNDFWSMVIILFWLIVLFFILGR